MGRGGKWAPLKVNTSNVQRNLKHSFYNYIFTYLGLIMNFKCPENSWKCILENCTVMHWDKKTISGWALSEQQENFHMVPLYLFLHTGGGGRFKFFFLIYELHNSAMHTWEPQRRKNMFIIKRDTQTEKERKRKMDQAWHSICIQLFSLSDHQPHIDHWVHHHLKSHEGTKADFVWFLQQKIISGEKKATLKCQDLICGKEFPFRWWADCSFDRFYILI